MGCHLAQEKELCHGDMHRAPGLAMAIDCNIVYWHQPQKVLSSLALPEGLFLTAVFTAVLLTTAKTRNHLKHPSTEECIKKMWYIYAVEYYSAIKKNERMPFAATVGIVLLSE